MKNKNMPCSTFTVAKYPHAQEIRCTNDSSRVHNVARTAFFFSSAPESERKPLSALIYQVFVYRFEPGTALIIIIIGIIVVWYDMYYGDY